MKDKNFTEILQKLSIVNMICLIKYFIKFEKL